MNSSYTSYPLLLNSFSSSISSRYFLSLCLSLRLLLLDLGFATTSGFRTDSALRFRVRVASCPSRSSARTAVWVARGGGSVAGIETTPTSAQSDDFALSSVRSGIEVGVKGLIPASPDSPPPELWRWGSASAGDPSGEGPSKAPSVEGSASSRLSLRVRPKGKSNG